MNHSLGAFVADAARAGISAMRIGELTHAGKPVRVVRNGAEVPLAARRDLRDPQDAARAILEA